MYKSISLAKLGVPNIYLGMLLLAAASAAPASQEELSAREPVDVSLNRTLELTSQQQVESLLKEDMSKLIKQLLNDFPDDLEMMRLAFTFHRRCQNYRYAMTLLEEALKAHPTHYDLLYLVVSESFNRGHYEKTILYAKQALAIKPGDSIIRVNYAIALSNLGRYSESIQELERAIDTSGGSVLAYQSLGQAYMQLKEYEKAKACFEVIIQTDASHFQANYALAQVYMKLKQQDKAREYMEIHQKNRALQLHQKDDQINKVITC